ncbi:hypothetical protein GGE65_007728 [Skermanella aerolata]|uniref:phage adaptor protein n=1 Tax=Skermanella aerolata TaxID=393310 RepID=UPI003D260213
MALANYSDLQTSIASWLNRDDLVSVIPDFIKLAEVKLNALLRMPQMVKEVTLTPDADGIAALPTDCLEVLSVRDGRYALDPLSVDLLVRSPGYNLSGEALNYAQAGMELWLAPKTSAPVTLQYLAAITPLASNSTNWLLVLAPDLYLFGALAASAPFLRDDARLPVWKQMHDEAAAVLTLRYPMVAAGPLQMRAI